jgi:phosphohistidine phosphatase
MLMRHGKSDWNAAFAVDHERPLAERGRRAATTMGVVLRRAGETPDKVVSSTAVRAETTAELARIGGGWSTPLELDEDLYGAGPAEAIAVAARRGGASERLMLVGHEPTWSMLTTRLTGGRVPVRTATVVAVDIDAPAWESAAGAGGSLAYVIHPRFFSDGSWDLT